MLSFIVTISILVTIHEFGHYWVARLCGVHVVRFSVGFGKPIWMKRGAPPAVSTSDKPLAPTEYAVAMIPLGGYVKMLDGREDSVPEEHYHLTFNSKSVWQRIAITAAGPLANFLLAIALYWMLFVSGVTGLIPMLGAMDEASAAYRAGLRQGQEIVAVDGTQTHTWSDVRMQLFDRLGETGDLVITTARGSLRDDYRVPIVRWLADDDSPNPMRDIGLVTADVPVPAVIGRLVDGSAASMGGVHLDDEVTRVNGEPVADWHELVELIQANPETSLVLSVKRGGALLELEVTPDRVERDGRSVGLLGVSPKPVVRPPEMLREINYPVYYAWLPAMQKTWGETLFTLAAIKKMILGVVSLENLSGPVTIARVAGATAEIGLESFIRFIALLSISLGVINLLPIPVLDGGHLFYYFIELVIRRPIPERVQVWGYQMGFFLLVSIMILALYNDFTGF